MQLSLWFNDHLVGNICDCFLSDDVWYGRLDVQSQAPLSAISQRIAEFMSFCESWNEQVRQGNEDADASQFEQFGDVVCNGCWHAKDQSGSMDIQIQDAPMFFVGMRFHSDRNNSWRSDCLGLSIPDDRE